MQETSGYDPNYVMGRSTAETDRLKRQSQLYDASTWQLLKEVQPFVDIAKYNRGVWVSEAITLVGVAGGLEGMSVRHGLKAEGRSPYGLQVTWRGMQPSG